MGGERGANELELQVVVSCLTECWELNSSPPGRQEVLNPGTVPLSFLIVFLMCIFVREAFFQGNKASSCFSVTFQ